MASHALSFLGNRLYLNSPLRFEYRLNKTRGVSDLAHKNYKDLQRYSATHPQPRESGSASESPRAHQFIARLREEADPRPRTQYGVRSTTVKALPLDPSTPNTPTSVRSQGTLRSGNYLVRPYTYRRVELALGEKSFQSLSKACRLPDCPPHYYCTP